MAGRKTADDLSASAQSVAKDLRNVRITTEPKKTGPDFMPGITLLAGFGAGIALMYFLDPERGRARRNLLRDKLMSWTRQASSDGQRHRARPLEPRPGHGDRDAQAVEWPIAGDRRHRRYPGVDAETGYIDHGSATGFGSSTASPSTGSPSTDPSTTDTWGKQPQTTSTTSY